MLKTTLPLMLCASGLSISAALGFSTDPSSLARSLSTSSAATNAPIVVTATFINGVGLALRGFCYTEQIPSGLSVTMLGLWVNGQSITNYTFESGLDNEVYPGCTSYRWMMELPPGFTANNPVAPSATVRIQYSITSPTAGSFDLQQFNWDGYNSGNTNAAFGYSESSDAQSVSYNAGPPPSFPPKITSLYLSNDLAVITWTSSAGSGYRVQYVDNLTDTNWTDLSPDVIADGPTAVATDAKGLSPQRFYRVLLVTP
jgi:hypothetical protein